MLQERVVSLSSFLHTHLPSFSWVFILHYDHVDPICEVSSTCIVFTVLILFMVFNNALFFSFVFAFHDCDLAHNVFALLICLHPLLS